MSSFLDWYALHNTLVIQSLAALIALLIILFIFRLFFANQETAEGSGQKNATFNQLEDKLNKLLEQQSQMKASIATATTGNKPVDEALSDDAVAALSGDPVAPAPDAAAGATATTGGSQEQVAELSRLRAEISTLKDSLKRKEVEIVTAKEQAVQAVNTSQQDDKLADFGGKISDYEKQIETLQSRLSDYEIISEDIADLQRYKKENQELKNQLSGAGITAPAAEPEPIPEPMPELTPELEVEAEPETIPVPEVQEEPSVPDDIMTAAAEALDEQLPAAEVDPDALPEALPAAELDNAEAREVSKDVKKEDKSLLDEFEKHFAKDDD